ncbi:MAG: hypothetical protein J6M66_09775 [Lachnospiraceae bacterium]|nr:hypothetical protein [Lachnospiraceae bacterium]
MGNFEGWLIKFGNVILPNSFLMADGWESSPNQRMELDAWRDANILLHRETAEDYKTQIKLNIRETTLAERTAFDAVIGLAELPTEDKRQRRVSITYWNDEELQYTSGVFYISNPKYKIYKIDEEKNDIEYDPFTITLTEY